MEYLKSSRFLTLLFLILTLVIGCVSMISVNRISSGRTISSEGSAPSDHLVYENGVDTNMENAQWIVRAHEDRIGVFSHNGTLQYVLDVYLITLPPSDQELLQHGIYVAEAEELTALIEDYTG